MEKNITALLITLLTFSCLCLAPVFNKTPDREYIVVDNDGLCDELLQTSEKWQTNSYFVYKLSENDKKWAGIIPDSKRVSEYLSPTANIDYTVTPLTATVSDGFVAVFGVPYTID